MSKVTAPTAAPAAPAADTEHRARLLEGMARAVAAKGYADTTIADIVREASVSRRTFYENFADKAECLTALYEAASGNAIAVLRAAIDPHSDWEAQVEQAMAAYFGVLARNPVLLRTLFIDILSLGPTGLAARRRANQQLADLMLDVVNKRPGERKRKAPLQPMMAMAVVGGINEMVLHSIEQDRAGQLQELVEPASTLLRAAISAEFTDRHFNHMRPSIAPQNSLRTTGISSQSHSGALVGSAAAKKVLCRRMISIAPGAPDTGTPRRAPASPLWPVTS